MLTGATLQRTAQRAQRVVEQAEHDGCYTWCGGEMDRGDDGQGLFSARLVRDDDDNDDVGWVGWGWMLNVLDHLHTSDLIELVLGWNLKK